MYIKYIDNIYCLNNYYSIVKGISIGSTKKISIHLMKDDSHFSSLDFDRIDARDYILNKIWEELEKGTICFDIDETLEIYLSTNTYKV